MIVPVVIGLCIIAVILLEAFETIILPRRVSRRFRLTRAFYLSLWVPTKAVARLIRSAKTREAFLSFFGPLSLLILFALWAACLIIGFGFLYYGNTPHDPTRPVAANLLLPQRHHIFHPRPRRRHSPHFSGTRPRHI